MFSFLVLFYWFDCFCCILYWGHCLLFCLLEQADKYGPFLCHLSVLPSGHHTLTGWWFKNRWHTHSCEDSCLYVSRLIWTCLYSEIRERHYNGNTIINTCTITRVIPYSVKLIINTNVYTKSWTDLSTF